MKDKKMEKNGNETKKAKNKMKIKKPVLLVIIFIGLIVLGYSGYRIVKWHQSNNHTNKQIEQLKELAPSEEVPADPNDAGVETPNEPEEKTEENKEDPYWDYINLPLINVDFTELLEKNPDTVGFIKVNGTNINYPIVQAKDNKYYLNRSFDKSYNAAGWIFLDYRNDINNLQDNSIIYGHSMLNKTMFGSLRNILENSWFKDTSNYTVSLSTPKENTLWQVFSVYAINEETYYLISEFGTDESHQKWIDTMLSRSAFDFKTTVNIKDRILTLSTCKNGNKRVVLHAKLIKKQAR